VATVLLGIVGAGIGSAFGNPTLGWSLGTTLAGVLFPPKQRAQERGRIDDLRVSGSSYGVMIPLVWGHCQVGGNIIWLGEVRETQTSERVRVSKKQRQTIRQYTYYATFAVLWCEAPDPAGVDGIPRIWANDTLIYDTHRDPATKYSLTHRYGAADQDVIDVMQAMNDQNPAIGVGATPAYRGRCYTLFDALPLTDFGNALPATRAEIGCLSQPVPTPVIDELLSFWPFELDIPNEFDHYEDRGPNEWTFVRRPGTSAGFPVGVPKLETETTGIQTQGTSVSSGINVGSIAVEFPQEIGTTASVTGPELTCCFFVRCNLDTITNGQTFAVRVLLSQGENLGNPLGGLTPGPSVHWELRARITRNEFGIAGSVAMFGRTEDDDLTLWLIHDVDWQMQVGPMLRQWRHVAFTFNASEGGRLRLYIDKVRVAQWNNTGLTTLLKSPLSNPDLTGTERFQVQWWSNQGSGSPVSAFVLDELMLLGQEVTETNWGEVLAQYAGMFP
jgi:hypothetical protein